MNIEIPQHIQDLMEEVWPDATPRTRANELRHLLYNDLRDLAKQKTAATGPMLPFETVPDEPTDTPKIIAERVAGQTVDIDLRNRVLIAAKVCDAQDAGIWNEKVEKDLIDELNQPFTGVRHGPSVQNSRIVAFFDWILD